MAKAFGGRKGILFKATENWDMARVRAWADKLGGKLS